MELAFGVSLAKLLVELALGVSAENEEVLLAFGVSAEKEEVELALGVSLAKLLVVLAFGVSSILWRVWARPTVIGEGLSVTKFLRAPLVTLWSKRVERLSASDF